MNTNNNNAVDIRTEGTLVPSSHRGRYALKIEKEIAGDLTSGTYLALWLGGQWVRGRIEYGNGLYHVQSGTAIEVGYYFIAEQGGTCGLCCGMRVGVV